MPFPFEYARKLLKSSKPETLQQAFDLLEGIGPGAAPLLPDILRHLDHKEKKISWNAARLVSFFGPTALPPLLAELPSAPLRKKVGIVRTLGLLGEEAADALPALQNLLHPQADPLLLQETAKALGHLKTHSLPALPALFPLASHPLASVRFATAFALGESRDPSPETFAICLRLLDDTDDTVSWAAIQALGNFGTHAASFLPRLLLSLQHPNLDVACHSARTLALIGQDSPSLSLAFQQALSREISRLSEELIKTASQLPSPSLLLGPLLSPRYLLVPHLASLIFSGFARLPAETSVLPTLLARIDRCVPSERLTYAAALCYLPPSEGSLTALRTALQTSEPSALGSILPHLPALQSRAWDFFPLFLHAFRSLPAFWPLLDTFLSLPSPPSLPSADILSAAESQDLHPSGSLSQNPFHISSTSPGLLYRFLSRFAPTEDLEGLLLPRLRPDHPDLAWLLSSLPTTPLLVDAILRLDLLAHETPWVRWFAASHLDRSASRPLSEDEEKALLAGGIPSLRLLFLFSLLFDPLFSSHQRWLLALSSLESLLQSMDLGASSHLFWFLELLRHRRFWLEELSPTSFLAAPDSPRLRTLLRQSRPRIVVSSYPSSDPSAFPPISALPSLSQIAFWLASPLPPTRAEAEIDERSAFSLWASSFFTSADHDHDDTSPTFLASLQHLHQERSSLHHKKQQDFLLLQAFEDQLF